jgi:hypothetical protein
VLLRRLDKNFERHRSDALFSVAQHIIDFVVHEFDIAVFISPPDILNGNAKLNMGFLAQIFAAHPNLTDTYDVEDEYPELMTPTSKGVDMQSPSANSTGRSATRRASFSSDVPVMPSPSSALSSPANSYGGKTTSTMSSPQSAPRNLPRSSTFLNAGSPRSTGSNSSRFFGSDTDFGLSDPSVQIPANISALVARTSPRSSSANSTPQPSPSVTRAMSVDRITPSSQSKHSAGKTSSFMISSPRSEGKSIADSSADTNASTSSDVKIPSNISALVSNSSTPRSSTPRSVSVSGFFAGVDDVHDKISGGSSTFGSGSGPPSVPSVIDIPAEVTAKIFDSVGFRSPPKAQTIKAFASENALYSTSSNNELALSTDSTPQAGASGVSEDSPSRGWSKGANVPKLLLNTELGDDDVDDVIDSLCDYHVADDLSTLDGNESAREEAPRRTFTDGYFGHNHTNKNLTDSTDFEMDEDMALLRWVNTHLERADSKRRITNFTYDLSVITCLRFCMMLC